MAYTTITKSTAHFDTNLYQANGSGKTISGMEFQPSLVWTKNRDSASYIHAVVDQVRGGTKKLFPDNNNAESTDANAITAFTSDGYTFGSSGSFNNGTDDYVNWCWKGNGAGSSNSDGTTTSTVSANTTAGFSIVKYSGSSSAKTIGHGLGVVPEMIIVKTISSGYEWAVYHKDTGHGKNLYLDSNGGASNTTTFWNNTAPTNSVFSVGGQIIYTNYSGQDYIAYCFASKPGYCKIGKYKSNSGTSNAFVCTGFKPSWLLVKRVGTDSWIIVDNKRNNIGGNPTDELLLPDNSTTELSDNINKVDLLSNGFKVRPENGASALGYGSSDDYIYMAFGQSLVGSNNVPATAR